MDWKQYVSVAALGVSMVSFTLSYNLTRQSAVTSVRPVLTFQFGVDGWSIRNVGNGPALDVLVAMKSDDKSSWTQPLRIPPLSRDGEFGLQKWDVYTNARTLGATYTDIQRRSYSTTCTNDLAAIHEENVLPTWPESEVAKHWDK